MCSTLLQDLTRQEVEDERTGMFSQRVLKQGTARPWRLSRKLLILCETQKIINGSKYGAIRTLQNGFQLANQVADILDTDRQTYQRIRDSDFSAFFRRYGCVGHDGRVIDQAFHATQAFGK